MSLALSTLIYEWRRYLAAIIALAFSGLLILAQVGLFAGIADAFTATIDRSRAEIMVMSPQSESLMGDGQGLPARVEPLIYLNPQVADVRPMDGDGALWRNHPAPGQKLAHTFVQLFTVGTEPGAVDLPTDYTEATRVALMEPYAVAVDATALGQLGVKLGDQATLNGKTVTVRAVLRNYPNVAQATVFVSRDTMRLLGMGDKGDHVGPLLVRIADPAKAIEVRDELNANSHGLYRAWTRQELSKANQSAILTKDIIGVLLVFSVILGAGIGTGITWQTLRGAIFANIKEFASLRALGVSMGALRMIVIELSFWVGIAGLLAAGLFVWGVSLLAGYAGLPMTFPPQMVGATAVLLVLIAVGSGFLSLGVLKQSQPADLLR
ncbi:MAG: ABC transporter permease [Caulobacteraceae bacterium]|nr:ABC transporter permease [Caulobacteraceae bacterium]